MTETSIAKAEALTCVRITTGLLSLVLTPVDAVGSVSLSSCLSSSIQPSAACSCLFCSCELTYKAARRSCSVSLSQRLSLSFTVFRSHFPSFEHFQPLPNQSIHLEMSELAQFDRSLTCMQQHADQDQNSHWAEIIFTTRLVRTAQGVRQQSHRLLSVECKVPPQTGTIVCVGLFDPPTWDLIDLPTDGLKLHLVKRAIAEVWSNTTQHQSQHHHFVIDPNPLPHPLSSNTVNRREWYWKQEVLRPLGLVVLPLPSQGWLVTHERDHTYFEQHLQRLPQNDPLRTIFHWFGRSPQFRSTPDRQRDDAMMSRMTPE